MHLCSFKRKGRIILAENRSQSTFSVFSFEEEEAFGGPVQERAKVLRRRLRVPAAGAVGLADRGR